MEPNTFPSQISYTTTPEPKPARKRALWLAVGAAAVVVALAVAVVVALTNTPALSPIPPATVEIESTGFSPTTVKVKEGQSVTWVNSDTTEHKVIGDKTALPDMQTNNSLKSGDSYTYPFEAKGTYSYYDPSAPDKYKGTVIVE